MAAGVQAGSLKPGFLHVAKTMVPVFQPQAQSNLGTEIPL
jgi:hypothetical protein